jgi:hypothetical protein
VGLNAIFTPRAFVLGAIAKIALTIVVLLSGCSASALRAHASTARLTRPAIDGVAAGLEEACSVERAEALGRAGDVAGYAQLRERCARGKASHETVRQAWITYLDAVLAGASGGDVDIGDVLAWGVRLAATYHALAELLRELGRDPPPLPAQLEQLVRRAR